MIKYFKNLIKPNVNFPLINRKNLNLTGKQNFVILSSFLYSPQIIFINILDFSFIIYSNKLFSQKDEKFWEDYSKMKAQGGKFPALESQEIIFNKTVHSWKYSNNHALTSDELFDCLKSLKKDDVVPFIILDVRESHEYDIYQLPKYTKVKFYFYFIEKC